MIKNNRYVEETYVYHMTLIDRAELIKAIEYSRLFKNIEVFAIKKIIEDQKIIEERDETRYKPI